MINFLSLSQVREITSLSKTTIYRLIGDDKFPPSIQLTERRVAWRASDVANWLEERSPR